MLWSIASYRFLRSIIVSRQFQAYHSHLLLMFTTVPLAGSSIAGVESWNRTGEHGKTICAMVKCRYIGDGHPTFNRNPYNGAL